ncbi:MAG: hypothetical protein FVQ80_17935 [Planctomycetes bacterium]|nr:hypothetical protein [Planctomycetota bacterium]
MRAGSDRDIQNWDQRLKDQVSRQWTNYIKRRIDLTDARELFLFAFAGEFIHIPECSSLSAKAEIRLNRTINDALDIVQGSLVKTIFAQLYLTNQAQAGEWIDIVIGSNFEYYKNIAFVDVESTTQECVVITKNAANTNETGPDQICSKVLLKADVKNAGIVWVDFGTAAVQDACIAFDPGEGARFKIPNLDQININLEIADELLFVVPEF